MLYKNNNPNDHGSPLLLGFLIATLYVVYDLIMHLT